MAEPHPEVVDPQHPLIVRLREICMPYPDAVEVNVWGRPTFRAGKKIFVVAGSSHAIPVSMVFKPDPDDEPALRQDARIFSPPYFGASGWLGLPLEIVDDWREVAELVDASYRQVALRRQLVALDAGPVLR
ncbi:MAG: MmcQ/YjbR family DNA-binding protein [Pseudolysinimonas sp.]